MIHICNGIVLPTATGCTTREYEEFCRLYFAGQLQLSPWCLSTFRADNHASDTQYSGMSRWIDAESAQVKMGGFRNGIDSGRPPAYKTAAAIPPEILLTILDHVMDDARDNSVTRTVDSHANVDRRVLADCSLVCSNWANNCRPVLFRLRVTRITTANQMRSLQAMLSWRSSSTSGNLKDLDPYTTTEAIFAAVSINVVNGMKTTPWLHNLGLMKLKLTPECRLSLHGNSQDVPMLRTINLLPSIHLPSTFIPYTELFLSDIRIRSLNILLRFLSQFTLVRKFKISGVICSEEHTLRLSRPTRHSRFRPGAFEVYVSSERSTRKTERLCLEICSFYPDFPLNDLGEVDESIACRLLTSGVHTTNFTKWMKTSWDGITDTVSFLCALELNPSFILSFTNSRLNATSNTRLLTALCLQYESPNQGVPEDSINFPALHATLQHATSLAVVLVSFEDFSAMNPLVRVDKIRAYPPQVTFQFCCRHRKGVPLPLTEDGSLDLDNGYLYSSYQIEDYGSEVSFNSHWFTKTLAKQETSERRARYFDYVWELIDPLTMRLTGEQFFEHDNIVPELLRRRGVHVVGATDCPSEKEIHSMLRLDSASS